MSLVIATFGFIATPYILAAMRTPVEVFSLASAYLRMIFLALPAVYLYTFVMMALRGAGDARTPFIFLAISAVLDVGLNPVFILGFGADPGARHRQVRRAGDVAVAMDRPCRPGFSGLYRMAIISCG